jgi:hypothetical protein
METQRATKIFISYRRADTVESASRLHEALASRFGRRRVFWDFDAIGDGEVFTEVIQEALASSKVFLAVIGRDWLTIKQGDTRRLDDPNDLVRLEIATALKQGIRVIPVLVEGASLPQRDDLPEDIKNLVEHQHRILRPQNWADDAKGLIRIIEQVLKRNYPYSLFFGALAGLISGTIVGVSYYLTNQEDVPPTRIIYSGLFGFYVGAVVSCCINIGLAGAAKLLQRSAVSKIIGATLGGAVGGLVATIPGGIFFLKFDSAAVDSNLAMLAVVGSVIFITLGILLPDIKLGWDKTGLSLIILACVIIFTASVMSLLLEDPGDWPGVLKIGLVCGITAGLEVGLALFAYDYFNQKLEGADS